MSILLDEKAIQEVTVKVPNGDSFSECFQNCYKVVAHAQAERIITTIKEREKKLLADGATDMEAAINSAFDVLSELEADLQEGK